MPSSSTPPRKNLSSAFRRFLAIGSDNIRKSRSRRHNDYYDNDANSLALSCTAADEETVPLSLEHAEQIVCKDHSTVISGTQSTKNVDLERRTELSKGKKVFAISVYQSFPYFGLNNFSVVVLPLSVNR